MKKFNELFWPFLLIAWLFLSLNDYFEKERQKTFVPIQHLQMQFETKEKK